MVVEPAVGGGRAKLKSTSMVRSPRKMRSATANSSVCYAFRAIR